MLVVLSSLDDEETLGTRGMCSLGTALDGVETVSTVLLLDKVVPVGMDVMVELVVLLLVDVLVTGVTKLVDVMKSMVGRSSSAAEAAAIAALAALVI